MRKFILIVSLLLLMFLSACATKDPIKLHTITDLSIDNLSDNNTANYRVTFKKDNFSNEYKVYYKSHKTFLSDIHHINTITNIDKRVDIIVDSDGWIILVTLSEHRK